MASMSKADRMSTSETLLADISIDDLVSSYNDIATVIEDFNDARSEAESSFVDALSYHEEREWDSRNDSLSNAEECVERMREQLDHIDDADGDIIRFDADRLAAMKNALTTVEQNIGILVVE